MCHLHFRAVPSLAACPAQDMHLLHALPCLEVPYLSQQRATCGLGSAEAHL